MSLLNNQRMEKVIREKKGISEKLSLFFLLSAEGSLDSVLILVFLNFC